IKRASGAASDCRPRAFLQNTGPHCQNMRGASKSARVSITLERVEERINTMSEPATARYDEEVLHPDDVPDAALELAGRKLWEGPAASLTAAFCSVPSCPSAPRK